MVEFATHGFTRATMKGIAEAAGVSTGLVQHHFGTKQGLRQACDAAVLEIVRRKLEVIAEIDQEGTARPDIISSLYGSSPLAVRYLIRVLVEGSEEAPTLFDELAAETERFLSDARPDLFPPGSTHARDGATVMTSMHLGVAVLEAHLSRRLGLEVGEPASAARVGLIMLDVYMTMADWIASDTGSRARTAIHRYAEDLDSGRNKEQNDG